MSPPEKSHSLIRRPTARVATQVSLYWKRNLVFIWLSQFFAMIGFTFAIPFSPYFIQELGVTDPQALKFWVSLFAASAPVTLAIFSPIWGALADRYGRRIMLLRSYVGGTILLLLMSTIQSVEMLIVLRLAQGVLTGTMTAAQTMVSTQTPPARSGTALGALSAAVFSGALAGSFAGGMFAELFGYRAAFMLSGVFLALAFMIVLLGVRERFEPAHTIARTWHARTIRLRLRLRPVFPLLALMIFLALVMHFEKPWIPLLVQEIHGSVKGAAVWSGFLFAISGVAGFLAGPLMGMLADRILPWRVARYCALGAGVLMVAVAVSDGFPALFLFTFGVAFFVGGIDPMLQIWLSRITPLGQRGLVFGWAATARSIGWMLAPLISGAFAALIGVRGVFGGAAVLLLISFPVITMIARRLTNANQRPRAQPLRL